MNEELQKIIGSVIQKGVTGAEGILGYIQQEAPDLIAQVLRYTLVQDIVHTLMLLGPLTFMLVKARTHFKWAKELYNGDYGNPLGYFALGISYVVMFILTLIIVPQLVSEIIKIVFAPKLFTLEYISHLIK